VKDGTFKGGIFQNDLKSGNVYLAINPRFEDRIPAAVMARVRKAEADIKAGRLNLMEK
jgi:basic membrane lipoprotein Med (substrate-binding protein (PBP1-ABC) superfamily)